MASPIRHISVFEALPLPSWAEGHATPASTPKRELPPEVLKAFAVVPGYLKVETCRNELGAGIDPTPGAYKPKFPPMTEAQLDACLAAIPNNNADWEEWNNTGLEIYAACEGADYGLAVWEKWSAKNPKYAGGDTKCADRWHRFHNTPPTRTGAGALVKKARAALNNPNWQPPRASLTTSAAEPMSLASPESVEVNPVAALMTLRDQGADLQRLLLAMNQTFAVVKYGSKIMIATTIGKELDFMKPHDFHNMLANLVVRQEFGSGTRTIIVSKHWFKWKHRRQYLGRGVVFEPGGPLEIQNDMLNLYRGFGVEPKQGDWSPMRNHIRDVICAGNEEHFQYVLKWMAYGVQHPDRPIGVAIALRGEEGAGKGFVWRNYGKLFGKHFKHIAHGEHLTGRFNAALAEACTVFLDEALWAGDRKGEQILKALVTEDTFQLERKFCDPIPVKNRLRIVIASNNQWIVPVSTRGRRYCVFDVSDLYADENDPAHAEYWEPLQAQFGDHAPDEGRAAMLYDLLHMDLSGFNIRAVPKSAAKTEQKLLTQTGTEAWLFEILQDGAVTKSSHGFRQTMSKWDANGMQISRDDAYDAFLQSSQERREYKPRSKEWWSRDLRKILKDCVSDERPRKDNPNRNRFLIFRPLNECRNAYGEFVHADDIDWESLEEPDANSASINSDADETNAEADVEWEPVDEPETDEADSGPVQVMPGPQ